MYPTGNVRNKQSSKFFPVRNATRISWFAPKRRPLYGFSYATRNIKIKKPEREPTQSGTVVMADAKTLTHAGWEGIEISNG